MQDLKFILKKPKLTTQNVVVVVASADVDVTIVEVNGEREAGIIHVCHPSAILIQGITQILPECICASTAGAMYIR